MRDTEGESENLNLIAQSDVISQNINKFQIQRSDLMHETLHLLAGDISPNAHISKMKET